MLKVDKSIKQSLIEIEPRKWSSNNKAKEIKNMKRHVPFTSVSVDPEIQRMRDILANGGYVDDDGSLYNDREAAAMNQDSGVKAKAVPKTVVSIEAGIQRMEGTEDNLSIDEDGSIISGPIVPKCCVSGARSVS